MRREWCVPLVLLLCLALNSTLFAQIGITPVTPNSAASRKRAAFVLPEKRYIRIPLASLPDSFTPQRLDDQNRVSGKHWVNGTAFGGVWERGAITRLGPTFFLKNEDGQPYTFMNQSGELETFPITGETSYWIEAVGTDGLMAGIVGRSV